MTYENPEEFVDSEEEKEKRQRRWCLNKALKLAKEKKTKQEPSTMSDNDVVEAARKFDEFINK